MRYVDALATNKQAVFVAAPLAGISHRAFRSLVSEYGGIDYYVNEMVSAESLGHNGQYESYYLDTNPNPEKTVIQLVGAEQTALIEAAQRIKNIPCAGIDINMGCSAPALLRKGAGAKWLDKPSLARDLVRALADEVGELGLSVKLRMVDGELGPLLEFCHSLIEGGVMAIAFHPRLRKDPWSRPAKKHIVPQVVRELSVPVVASGDIVDAQSLDDYRRLHREASCPEPAGYMIGRALVSQPWLGAMLQGLAPAQIDRLACIERFHCLLETHQPRDFWFSRARRFYQYFATPLVWGTKLGGRAQTCLSYKDLLPLAHDFFATYPEDRWVRAPSS